MVNKRGEVRDLPIKETLHKNEIKLIKFIREIKYGEITIKIQNGIPVMIEKATEKVKL